MITHQWCAGEVVNIERIHLQLKVNTVGMLSAVEQDNQVKLTAYTFMMRCHVYVLLTASE